jgi:hypothetical protein
MELGVRVTDVSSGCNRYSSGLQCISSQVKKPKETRRGLAHFSYDAVFTSVIILLVVS